MTNDEQIQLLVKELSNLAEVLSRIAESNLGEDTRDYQWAQEALAEAAEAVKRVTGTEHLIF